MDKNKLNLISDTLKDTITGIQEEIQAKQNELIAAEKTLQPIRHSLSALNTMQEEIERDTAELSVLDTKTDANKIEKIKRNITWLENNIGQELKRIEEYCTTKNLS